MTAPIAIQPPHIDPGIFQRSSGGGESGLEPLIAALQFYKKSKLEEQKNQIDAVRAGSEANFYNAHADELRNNMKRQQDEDEAWDKQIAGAPSIIQPFLRAVSAARTLPPELRHVVGAVLAQQIPGVKPEQMTALMNFLRLGMPLSGAATLSHIKVYDIADKNDPLHADPDAIGLDKKTINFKFTPPATEAREQAMQLRAQNDIVNDADRDNASIRRDVQAQMQKIAQDQWNTTNPGQTPAVKIQYDARDPNQVRALHAYMQQHHLYDRLNLNTQNRAAAESRINATASGAGVQTPEAMTIQQRVDAAAARLQQKSDSADAVARQAADTSH